MANPSHSFASRLLGLAPFILTLLAPQPALAQCPSPGWQGGYRSPGVTGNVFALSACRNPDGSPSTNSFVAAGTFIFSTDRDLSCRYVAKWNGLTWEPLGGGLNSNVKAIATMPNGDIIAAGGFLSVDTAGTVNNIARWNGASWSRLGTGLTRSNCLCGDNATALAVIALPNGDVIASGVFDRAGSVPVNHIARWNGVEWSALGAGLDIYAYAFATLPNGDLIAAGEFTSAGGLPASNIARWDGNSWSPLGSGVSGPPNLIPVQALTVLPNGDVIAAGNFTSAGGLPASGVARWNGSEWSAMGQGITGGPVNSLTTVPDASGDADIIAGGDFTTADGLPAARLARWHAGSWYAMGTGAPNQVRALISLPGRQIVAGGSFLAIDGLSVDRVARGEVAPWPGETLWSAQGDGLSATSSAMALLPQGDLIVAGSFDRAGSIRTGPIARWNGPAAQPGHRWSTFAPGLANIVNQHAAVLALDVDPNGDVIAGGNFSLNGSTAVNIARWNGSTWSALGTGTDTYVRALARLPGGDLIAGGSFTTAGGVPANRIARWNGSTWSPMGAGMDADVNALIVTPAGDLVAGGSFTTAGGASANRIARWNGTAWTPLGSGLNATVYAFATLPGGDLAVGGAFTTAGNASANRIARWNGSQWSRFATGITAGPPTLAVRSLTLLVNGDLVAAGYFSAAGGLPANCVARWNGSAWSNFDNGGVVSGVQAMATMPGGDLVLGGNFNYAQLSDGFHLASCFAHYSFGGSPIIARQPASVTTCFAGSASFSSPATGSWPLAYRWQSLSVGQWIDIADASNTQLGTVTGSSSPTLSLTHTPAAASGTSLRCVVTNSCATAISNPATLTVCASDFDCDGTVDFFDYDAFVTCFEGACPPGKSADFNGNGAVDFFDYDAFVTAFETTC